jgi:hypothetical protein
LLHREAAASADAIARSLAAYAPDKAPTSEYAEQHHLASEMRALAAALAPGWLGAPLDALPKGTPLGDATRDTDPLFIRIGTAQPLDDARFPVVVPLLRAGHLAVNADARDQRVAALLRSLALRLLAASRPGSVTIKVVDPLHHTFDLFGLPTVADPAGLKSVLNEAEQWIRDATRPDAARHRDLVVLITALPELTESTELLRIAALAQTGPGAGVHLIVAGWPPAPISDETSLAPLANATQISVRNPYVIVSDPPGGSFGVTAPQLSVPVYLDPEPPHELISETCAEVFAQARQNTSHHLGSLMPAKIWQDSSAHGMVTTVGWAHHAGADAPVTLRFNDLSPHWLIGGRAGAGKSAFLVNVLYGLCSRYSPDELHVYLADFAEGLAFGEFTPNRRDPSFLPQTRAIGIEADREYGLSMLISLDAELTDRSIAMRDEGANRFTELRRARTVPRIVCVLDEYQVLLNGDDDIARRCAQLLEALVRKGRAHGIHLILAGRVAPVGQYDAILSQFPLRIALPGGGHVLDPRNEAAAGIAVGTAVINTASGLGGPSGASRAHERTVEFPDPHAEEASLGDARTAIWKARDKSKPLPPVFVGHAPARLADDPTYQSLKPPVVRPTVLVGRVVDTALSTAAFSLDASPGRHVAVLGRGDDAVQILTQAAISLAAQHDPGSVTFTLLPLVAAADRAAAGLRDELVAAGHKVILGDATHLSDPPTGYVIGYGMEAVREHPDLGRLVNEGPAQHRYLLGWWRSVRRFATDTPPGEQIAGLVLLDVTAEDLRDLGLPGHVWQPRPGRALLHDRHDLRTQLFVPFRAEGEAR